MKISNDDSPAIIAQELGARLRQARLNLNVTQASLARLAGVSRKKVMHAEAGETDLLTLVALLRAMRLADKLELFLPPLPISPIQLAKLAGKRRQRASGDACDSTNAKKCAW